MTGPCSRDRFSEISNAFNYKNKIYCIGHDDLHWYDNKENCFKMIQYKGYANLDKQLKQDEEEEYMDEWNVTPNMRTLEKLEMTPNTKIIN